MADDWGLPLVCSDARQEGDPCLFRSYDGSGHRAKSNVPEKMITGKKRKGDVSVIASEPKGSLAMDFSSDRMPRKFISGGGNVFGQ